jgi:hypothetical protein
MVPVWVAGSPKGHGVSQEKSEKKMMPRRFKKDGKFAPGGILF